MHTTLTFGDLLSAVDLGNLLLKQLITLLADIDNLCTRHAELRHGSQNLFRDLGSSLILGESIGVVEGVIYLQPLALLPCVGQHGPRRLWSCAAVVKMALGEIESLPRFGGVPK